MSTTIFWFRRDLRIEDNHGLYEAMTKHSSVLPIFIFDCTILDQLDRKDRRVSFIYDRITKIHSQLKGRLKVFYGDPIKVWESLTNEYSIQNVVWNKDYEPAARKRDEEVEALLKEKGIEVNTYKDQVIFEEEEVVKDNGEPYTVFTPYKNKWLKKFNKTYEKASDLNLNSLCTEKSEIMALEELGFERVDHGVRDFDFSQISDYGKLRDFPASDVGSYLGPHLRFGTISIREVIHSLMDQSEVFVSELIWREFFMQILWHFPESVKQNFKRKYDGVKWRNNEEEFQRWCEGKTGYLMVDAGIRELNATGYMHNRVRMVVASFLCKHLLIDWRWGEAYFANKLLDYEQASNIGNWQWAAGTGCDAAPYFRVFNPHTQLTKFDKDLKYIKKWVPEWETLEYQQLAIVDHAFARQRALDTYKKGLDTEV